MLLRCYCDMHTGSNPDLDNLVKLSRFVFISCPFAHRLMRLASPDRCSLRSGELGDLTTHKQKLKMPVLALNILTWKHVTIPRPA